MPSLTTTAPATLTRLPTLRLEPNRIINGIFYQYIANRGGWLIHENKNPAPTDHDILGLGTRRGRQRFVDGRPEIIAEIPDGPPLPSADELNAQIPEADWSIGLSGKPEAPWKNEFIFYGPDLHDLTVITYSNSTIGAARAIEDLEDKWNWARILYGEDVRPLVHLSETAFPTSYGERKRPVFRVGKTDWRVFRDGALCVVDTSTPALASPQSKSLSEALSDKISF
jgi:hypothetical protein